MILGSWAPPHSPLLFRQEIGAGSGTTGLSAQSRHRWAGFQTRLIIIQPVTDGQNMSKSYGNSIPIFGSHNQIKKAVMGIVTDSTPVEDPKDTDSVVFELWSLFADEADREEMFGRARAGGYRRPRGLQSPPRSGRRNLRWSRQRSPRSRPLELQPPGGGVDVTQKIPVRRCLSPIQSTVVAPSSTCILV